MNKTQKMLAVVAVIGVVLASGVTASSSPSTPLYTLRMEKESYRMNFLPTTVNEFTFVTEKGCTLSVGSGVGNTPCSSTPTSPQHLCEMTVETSCPLTCIVTCPVTCAQSCGGTCVGETCEGSTCGDPPC